MSMKVRILMLISYCVSFYLGARATDPFNFYERPSDYPDRGARILSLDNIKKKESVVIDFGYLNTENAEEFQQFIGNVSDVMKTIRSRSITVLVPMRYEMERKSHKIMDDVVRQTPLVEYHLRKYNSSGVTSLLAKTDSTNYKRDKFMSRLLDLSNTSSEIGANAAAGDAVFFSTIKICKEFHSNSAILIFVDRMPIDEDLAQLANKELTAKSIKVFIMWGGQYPASDNRQLLLQQTAHLTKGHMFVMPRNMLLEHYESAFLPDMPENTIYQTIIAHRTNLAGSYQFIVPIDTEVIGLHLSLPTSLKRAVLRPPYGEDIDLLSEKAVHTYSRDSIVFRSENTHEVQLDLSGHSRAGKWRLATVANDDAAREDGNADWESTQKRPTRVRTGYNVTVAVASSFRIVPRVVNDTQVIGKRFLRLDILGEYGHLERIQFEDALGLPYNPSIKYQLHKAKPHELQAQSVASDDVESLSDTNEIDIPIDDLPQHPIFVRINGTDKKGKEFVRMAYIDRVNLLNPLPSTTIDMGLQSELLVTPNRAASLYFEVSNNREQMSYMRFGCRDEQSLLVRMQPLASYVSPGQTVVVTVQMYIRATAASDRVTFSAFSGSDRYTKSAEVRVTGTGGTSAVAYDRDRPELWRTFNSDCLAVTVCHEKMWSVTISAKDTASGLLQLTSSPKGLYFPIEFVAGTREEVSAYYSASCCESRIQAIAYDLNHNRRYIDIDAYWAPLTPGIIAAIVLGVLLFVGLSIGVWVGVVLRKKSRRADSFDLPTYQGPTRSASTRRY